MSNILITSEDKVNHSAPSQYKCTVSYWASKGIEVCPSIVSEAFASIITDPVLVFLTNLYILESEEAAAGRVIVRVIPALGWHKITSSFLAPAV